MKRENLKLKEKALKQFRKDIQRLVLKAELFGVMTLNDWKELERYSAKINRRTPPLSRGELE